MVLRELAKTLLHFKLEHLLLPNPCQHLPIPMLQGKESGAPMPFVPHVKSDTL